MGDWIGRRYGLIQNALLMFVGLVFLSVAHGYMSETFVKWYGWALFFYGMKHCPHHWTVNVGQANNV